MKRAPSPRPDWIDDLLHRARLGQHHRLSRHPGSAVAALGGQPRLHRPESMVRAVRRCRPARLSALRSRSRSPGATFAQVLRDGAARARRARRGAIPATRRPRARAAFTCTCPSCAARRRRRCGHSPSAGTDSWRHRTRDLITAEYRVAKRPRGHVLVDYNQNAWGRTLASVYSVRPQAARAVSTPVTWDEIEHGVRLEDFRIDNVPERVAKHGDLWKPLLAKRGRARLGGCYESRLPRHMRPWRRSWSMRFPPGADGSTSPSGTASAVSLSAMAARSSCNPSPASR